MKRFCSICGKVTDELIENRCKDCFVRETKLIDLPEELKVNVCRDCWSYLRKGHWIKPEDVEMKALKEASNVAIKDSLDIFFEDARIDVELGEIKKSSDKLYLVPFQVLAEGKLKGIPVEVSRSSIVKLRIDLCNDCNRRRSSYYEAILQVRGEEPLTEKEVREVRDTVEKSLSAMNEARAFISDIQKLKAGLDFYMGSTKAARKLARILKGKFDGKITESPKLVSRKDGRDSYRVSIAVRLANREKL